MNAAVGIVVLSALGMPALPPVRHVPSHPADWNQGLLSFSEPTPTCPGGSIGALRKHMTVSGPHLTPEAFLAGTHIRLPRLEGVLAGDTYHSFQFRADLADGRFWGFDGYLVNRGACIIHAEITSHDN